MDGYFNKQLICLLGTNGTLLLVDLILYSYEAEFIQGLVKAGKNRLAEQFNVIYRYTDNVLSLNISKFSRYLELIGERMCTILVNRLED